jgi:hypothetical protein
MRTYTELISVTKQERFAEVFNYVTAKIKNQSCAEIMKTALLGVQDKEVKNWKEAFCISELCANGFISAIQSDCLIELIK